MRKRFVIAALILLSFAWINAQIAESVGTIQLERVYACLDSGIVCARFGFIS